METKEGKITYTRRTISDSEAVNIALNLGYQEIGNRWFVYRIPHLAQTLDKTRQMFLDAGMQIYLPTYARTFVSRGQRVKRQVPKLFDYVFVLATLEQVQALMAYDNVSPVISRFKDDSPDIASRWLTVPASQMHSLMIVIQGYEQEVQFLTPEEHLLAKGDRVAIVDGPFKGVEGILVTSQGQRGGHVYVSVSSQIGIMTLTIEEEDIQVLEFSRQNNHLALKMQAIEKTLASAFDLYQQNQSIRDHLRATLQFFLARYAHLQGLSHVSLARLTACRYAALHLLGLHDEAIDLLRQYKDQVQQTSAGRRAERRSPSALRYIESWVDKFEDNAAKSLLLTTQS